jgi:hypothetical protein
VFSRVIGRKSFLVEAGMTDGCRRVYSGKEYGYAEPLLEKREKWRTPVIATQREKGKIALNFAAEVFHPPF